MRAGNRYLEKTAPWTLLKQGNTEKLNTVLYVCAELLRNVSVLLYPVMPEKMGDLREAIGLERELDVNIRDLTRGGNVMTGKVMKDREPLFMRIMVEKETAQPKAAKAKVKEEKKVEEAPLISIDKFFETKLKTAKVLTAEKVPDSTKLLRLEIDLGGETRQIVSGIAEHYTPESLIGKTIVVVANLAPAKIRGVDSYGMLLAAKSGKTLRLVTLDGDVPPGVQVG